MSSIFTYIGELFGAPVMPEPAVTPEHLIDRRPCRFRLDDGASSTFTLPDGRKLGYAQYGSLTGRPILYQHGLPGSRFEASAWDDMGKELGARLIAIDRPGYGWSTPHAGRTLLDWPKDLEKLADHLELKEYGVVGISGGGPYALACAYALPREKLKGVSIICGMGPPDIGMKGADWKHWAGFPNGWRIAPLWLVKMIMGGEPGARIDLSDEKRLEMFKQIAAKAPKTGPLAKDREFFNDEDILRLSLRTAREAFARGCQPMHEDAIVMCSDFGFKVQDIRHDLPVQLWYGKNDCHVPLVHGQQIAARLGGRAQFNFMDETHASIYINCRRDALEALVKSM